MPPSSHAIQQAVSIPRLSTYVAAVTALAPNPAAPLASALDSAVKLYGWNAAIAAAFLHPLHICEVTLRNAVSKSLERLYGPNWPTHGGFIGSLPLKVGTFKPRQELERTWQQVSNSTHPTVGHLIAELKFSFWEHLLTSRYQPTIWDSQFALAFPHRPATTPINTARNQLHREIRQVRSLRNRIAHHEPIFSRALDDELQILSRVIGLTCPDTLEWMRAGQLVHFMLGHRPI